MFQTTKNIERVFLGSLLSLTLFVSGCGFAAADGEWASGEPDNGSSSDDSDTGVTLPDEPDIPSEPPIASLFLAFDPKIQQLANGPGMTWNGCHKDAIVRGGYDSDTQCGNGTVLPAYADHLNRHFFSCVETGAFDAGFTQPQRVFVRHWGTYVNRNARGSTSLSMHAYARAIDVVKFILLDRDGKATSVSTNVRDFKGATMKFYNSFRQCWKESMPAKCKPGQREYSGSIGIPGSALGGNSLHNDHIHLSFPFCAG
jgi:hypothetical protein